MRKGCFFVVLFLICLAIAGSAGYFFWGRGEPPVWNTVNVDRGPIRIVVSASGSLAAVTTVMVGCQISGIIASISADFNDMVRAGQLIAQIDPSTLEAHVLQARANLENARATESGVRAQRENLKASLLTNAAEQKVQAANLTKARVSFEDAERNLRRTTELFSRKLVSQADLDVVQTARDNRKADLESAKAQLDAAKAKELSVRAHMTANQSDLDGAKARIRQMEAQLDLANINLSRTRIYSPIDGVIISRNVDVGQTVAANLHAPTLFTIAQDLRRMQIDTAVDEADIGKVRKGQMVTFTVDAYRDRSFSGIVQQVRLAPSTSANVVTYSVMVTVNNDDLLLKPGMTANVEILVDEKSDILRVPTIAFYFKPPTQYVIEETSPRPSREHEADRLSGPSEGRDFPRQHGESPSTGEDETIPKSTLWITSDDGQNLHGIPVKMGIGNNQFSEIAEGDLSVGQEVVVALGNSAQSLRRPSGPSIRIIR